MLVYIAFSSLVHFFCKVHDVISVISTFRRDFFSVKFTVRILWFNEIELKFNSCVVHECFFSKIHFYTIQPFSIKLKTSGHGQINVII